MLSFICVGPQRTASSWLDKRLRQHHEIALPTNQNNLSDRIHFLGFRTDIPEIMKACDVYVQSSRWEGFGLVAVEAMASGLPVVASNVGSPA